MLLGCNANDSKQEIRAVCKSTDTEGAGCTHITQNGAVDTVVRLPNSVSLNDMVREVQC
jgi:hypothetical protein